MQVTSAGSGSTSAWLDTRPAPSASEAISISVPVRADDLDGYEDPTFRISGDGIHNDWIGTATNVMTGWIFTNVPIAKGATISSSFIRFRGYGNGGSASARIKGFAEDNAAPFLVGGTNKPSTRAATTALTDWTNTWSFQWQWFQTPDLSPVVQQVVDRSGWTPGNSIGFRVSNPTGTGTNWAVVDYAGGPYDGIGGPGNSVTLYVSYTQGQAPVRRVFLPVVFNKSAGAPNTPLLNGDFESEAGGQPDHWSTRTVQGAAAFAWDSATSNTGFRSVQVSGVAQSIARWEQTIAVEPDAEYKLAGWIKTANVQDPAGQWWTTGAKIGVYGTDSALAAATQGLRGTQDWTYVSVRFITGKTSTAKVACTLGDADSLYVRSTSSGIAWCDDLTLTMLQTLPRSRIQGRHVALDVYTQDFTFTAPPRYVQYLDEVYEAMQDLVAGVPFDGSTVTVQSDASMNYALLSGNPIRIGPGRYWADIVNRNGIDFGVPHELGHDFDIWPHPTQLYMGQMTFDGAEHWANSKVLYAYDILGGRYPSLTVDLFGQTVPISQAGRRFVDAQAQPWLNAGRTDYQNMGNDVYTGLNYLLRQRIGWGPFKNTFREYVASSSATIPATDVDKVQLWASTLSRYAGEDLIPTFQSWGFPVR